MSSHNYSANDHGIISYPDGDTSCLGYVAGSQPGAKKPCVIFCHDFRGQTASIREKADQAAAWGYVGFAADIYGAGKVGSNREENSALMAPFVQDRRKLNQRLAAAYNCAENIEGVDVNRIAVIGYCFGGLAALDLARSEPKLKGAVSVHGFLHGDASVPNRCKAKVMVLHGSLDPMVAWDRAALFRNEFTEAGADWQFIAFGQSMHAFTNPIANDIASGTMYNPVDHRRAEQYIRIFLDELFI